jgi:hypothetical protein
MGQHDINLPTLLPLDEAADRLGVPRVAFRNAAEENGLVIKIGRKPLINVNDIERLLKKCQGQQKERGSTNSPIVRSGTSATRAAPTPQLAVAAAKKLRKSSRHTSQPKAAQVLPMNRQP